MKRLFRNLDVFFSVTLFSAVCMAVLTALPLPSQAAEVVRGSGQAITERRSAGVFDAIEVAGDFELRVRQGSTPVIEVQAEPNLLPYLETLITEDRKLVIRWQRSAHCIRLGVGVAGPLVSIKLPRASVFKVSSSALISSSPAKREGMGRPS